MERADQHIDSGVRQVIAKHRATGGDMRRMMVGWSLAILLATASAAAQKQKADATHSPNRTHAKTGQIVINPQFDEVGEFSEGLAAVRIAGKWGFINKLGKYVINPQFDNVKYFHEGLAPVRVGDEKAGRWGYIDKDGRYAINPQWDDVTEFNKSVADVRIGDILTGKKRQISKDGKYISSTEGSFEYQCDNGLKLVGIGVHWDEHDFSGRYGFVDKTGTYVINPQFDDAYCFSDGVAPVRIGNVQTGKWGYIDTTGHLKLATQWDKAYRFENGIASVAVIDETDKIIGAVKKWGIIDKKGGYVVKPEHYSELFFSEGLAEVCESTSRWKKDVNGKDIFPISNCGFIDNHGIMAIDLQWESAFSFSQGLAAVRLGDILTGKWGYIDKAGKYVINPQFDDVSYFSEGLAAVRIGDDETGKWGFIAR